VIEAISAIEPPQRPALDPIEPPSAPALRAAMNGSRRFIIQFAADVSLPDGDEIACTPQALAGIIPDEAQRSLSFSEATAWLRRLYPDGLGARMDQQAAELEDTAFGDDVTAPGFARYYCLRFTGGLDDDYILGVLSRANTIAAVQLEAPFELLVTHADPEFANQDYLKAAPNGISVESAWNAGADGSGATIGFAEPGFVPSSHPDITFAKQLGAGGANFSEHMLNVSGVFGSLDNGTGIVGVAPGIRIVFSATDATPGKNAPSVPANTLSPAASYVGIALLNDPSELKAGDVVNFSIAANVELDQNKSPSVGPTLPTTLPGARGQPGALRIAMAPAPSKLLKKVTATLPLEFDPALLALIRQFTGRGVTVCMGAGNGYIATYIAGGTTERDANTGVGADLAEHWLHQVHSLDRFANDFKDGGGIVVGGGFFSPSKQLNIRNPNFSKGNRIDCFAQGSDVLTWATSTTVRIAGTSVATPIVSGAAALVQHFVRKNFQQTLKPRVLRAILSDPLLNTPAEAGSQIGVMPDLAKIIALLKTNPLDNATLIKALKDAAAKTHADVAQRRAGSQSGTAQAPANTIKVHDPYTVWNEQKKTWDDMPLDTEQDVFN